MVTNRTRHLPRERVNGGVPDTYATILKYSNYLRVLVVTKRGNIAVHEILCTRYIIPGINIYTFILARCSLSALETFFGHFSAASLVSSRGLRPAIALSREGLARVRVRPRRGPTRRASEVARSRLRGFPHVASPRSPTRAPITAPFPYNDQSVGVLVQSRGHALFFLSLSGLLLSWCFCHIGVPLLRVPKKYPFVP